MIQKNTRRYSAAIWISAICDEISISDGEMMIIVYITVRYPYPALKGDQVIAYQQIKRLSKKHKVHLITFREDKIDLTCMEKYCEEIVLLKNSKSIRNIRMLKTFFNGKPFQVNRYTNRENLLLVERIINRLNPDIVHVQTIRMAEYGLLTQGNNFIDYIDNISLNMKRRASKENALSRLMLNFESRLVKRYQERIFTLFQNGSYVSEKDLDNTSIAKYVINPNGIDEEVFKIEETSREDIIVFHGNMNYFPNIDAAITFATDYWPAILKKYPNYQFYIVGDNPSSRVLKLNGTNNIVVTGYVEDVFNILKKAKIGIYILNIGTGLQNKILEALAIGLPVIASDYALNGFKNISENEVIRANTVEEVLEGTIELIENKEKWLSLKNNGKVFVMENYTWNKNIKILEEMWRIGSEDEDSC